MVLELQSMAISLSDGPGTEMCGYFIVWWFLNCKVRLFHCLMVLELQGMAASLSYGSGTARLDHCLVPGRIASDNVKCM